MLQFSLETMFEIIQLPDMLDPSFLSGRTQAGM